MRLRDRTAFISGAGGPMGGTIARRFAEEGARLVLTDISGPRLDEWAAPLRDLTDVVAERANVLEEQELTSVVGAGQSAFGGIDIVVNVVGGVRGGSLRTSMLELSDDALMDTMALNLKGILLTTRHIVPGMRERGYGRIVNFASVAMAGETGQSAYSAAKAGVAGITRSMAMEFAPDVTVNAIAPALVRTSVLDRLDPAMIEEWRQRTLLKRLAEPEDIANAALFLASDEASFITGVTLPLAGGIWPAL